MGIFVQMPPAFIQADGILGLNNLYEKTFISW
jgi:hypothetical protein